jgi:hypothetical protein
MLSSPSSSVHSPVKSPFVRTREDALRHVNLLGRGLKKVAWAGLIGGLCCGVLAVLEAHFLTSPSPQPNAILGAPELSGISFIAWFMAIALLVFSILYYTAGWCVWLGRGSIAAMAVFLLVASWDFYGLWVLLSKETGQLFASPNASSNTTHASGKPANLVT